MNKKILYFDDESLTSEFVVKNLIENFGHDITNVSSISSFIEQLKKEKYALLIIDIMAPIPPELESLGFEKSEIEDMNKMEGMNTGMILANRVWRMNDYIDVPVIFITAKSSFSLPNNHKCSIIRKPSLAKNISQEINNMLNNNAQ